MSDASSDASRELAERLLDAQVAFFEAQLGPEQFAGLLEAEVDHWLAAAAQLTLGEMVTRQQITDVAIKYATGVDIPGSIPELANEIADRIYGHPAQSATRLEDVVAKRHIEAFTTKLLELPLVQERLMESPLMVEIVSELLFRLATDAAATNRELAGRIPGVSSLLGAGTHLLNSVAKDATKDFEVRLQELSGHAARLVLRRAKGNVNTPEEPWIRDAVIEMWREQSSQPVSSLQTYVTQEDLEDLLVLLYEFWLSLRETDYVHALIAEGVDFFFDKYTDATLLELIEEFGVGRSDILEEAHRFAPPILAVLRERGLTAAFLRRRLEPFFASPETLALLGDPES
jgi:hypothetical protein